MNRIVLLILALAWISGGESPAAPADPAAPAQPAYPVSKAAPAPAPAIVSTSTAPAPPPSAPAQTGASELEKLALPIALHPDPLIAIMLPAAAYPVEIVQAARFVKDTNNLAKLDQQPWDENVKAVAKFPELIAQMDRDLDWTAKLGQAFLDQPKELMDTIQSLRAKAHKAGTLQSTAQQVVNVTNIVVVQTNATQVVTVTNQIVQVQPANPQVVYVPTYPPTVYYPPPSYVYDPWAPLVSFGVAVGIGAIIANNCDWHGGCVWVGGGGAVWVGGGGYGDVDIDIDNDINIDRGDRPDRGEPGNRGDRPSQQSGNRAANTGAKATQQKWQPDQNRLRSSGAPASAQSREARGWGGASTQPAQRPAGGAAGGAAGARPSQQPSVGAGGARPGAQPAAPPSVGNRAASTPSAAPRTSSTWSQPASRAASSPAASSRSSASPSVSRSSSSSAFSGAGSSGSSARATSSRGSFSRGGGGGSRGGGGRGR